MPRPTIFPDQPGQLHIAAIYYDFDLDGGKAGEPIALPGILPTGAIFINAIVHILHDLTGDPATAFGLSLGGHPLVPLEALDQWTMEGAGLKVTDIFKPGDYDPLRLLEPEQVYVVIEGTDLTSGRIGIHLIYFMSPDVPAQLVPASDPPPPAEEEEPPPPPADEEPAPDPPPPEECDEPEAEVASKSK